MWRAAATLSPLGAVSFVYRAVVKPSALGLDRVALGGRSLVGFGKKRARASGPICSGKH
jgi:hypothetical protein